MRHPCPGVRTIPGAFDGLHCYCPACGGGPYALRTDGTVGWHPMNYERVLRTAAEALDAHDAEQRRLERLAANRAASYRRLMV